MRHHVPLTVPDLPDYAVVADRLEEVLRLGQVSNFGRYTTEFEQALSRYLGASALTTSSGTQGLILVLQALGVAHGAKVILPSFTFVATAQAVLYAGGRPLFADVGEDLTLDSLDLAALLDQNLDAAFVLPVHTHGQPCDTEAITRVVQSYSSARRPIRTVYDAAQAMGAQFAGQQVGSFGDAEVFSLSSSSPVVAAEGGVISTRSEELIQRIRRTRDFGRGSDQQAWFPGLNGRLSELHAILGLANLATLETRMSQRQILARNYAARIHERTDFRPAGWPADARPTFSTFTVLVPDSLAPRREQVMARLAELGIETATHCYPPVHEQRWFRTYADRPLPRTEGLARRALALPFHTRMSDDDLDHVVDGLRRVRKELS